MPISGGMTTLRRAVQHYLWLPAQDVGRRDMPRRDDSGGGQMGPRQRHSL